MINGALHRGFVFSMEVASIVGAVALLVALVALAFRKWSAAWKIARVSFWIPGVSARVFAETISEAMNGGALVVATAVPSALVAWWARRKVRVARRET